jgi:hypothetical protein
LIVSDSFHFANLYFFFKFENFPIQWHRFFCKILLLLTSYQSFLKKKIVEGLHICLLFQLWNTPLILALSFAKCCLLWHFIDFWLHYSWKLKRIIAKWIEHCYGMLIASFWLHYSWKLKRIIGRSMLAMIECIMMESFCCL